jgi:hypothetical protein
MSMFATPAAPGSGVVWADLAGRLLLIEPHSVEQGIKTSFGDATAVRADVHVLDGEPADYLDTLVFPKVLGSQLAKSLGQQVLGRLGQGAAKPGQSPPWLLLAPDANDTAIANAWVAARTAVVAPAAPAPAAAPAAVPVAAAQGQPVPF